MQTIDIGPRRELFVDRFLVESLEGVTFKLHTPQLTAPATSAVCGHYMTVLQDGDRYRTYCRQYDPSYKGELFDGNPAELTCCEESRDGIEWQCPEFGLFEVNGSRRNNTVLRQVPYSHNFALFLDANPSADPAARYKALAGIHPVGLHAFRSADGVRWEMLQDQPVITSQDFAFDSQNVAFWSSAESCYVCYFRSWQTPHGALRTVSRTTSADFVSWTKPVPMNPNLPGEHLYTSQTHPYFRAPHIYIALPTRFQPDRGSSTDILFMATRAGSERFERLFTEAFIPPGPDPKRWGNRSNYAACGVVPTGTEEMSIYHGPSGRRYALRTDGFVSLHAGFAAGAMTTKPFTFTGAELSLNMSTSAAGSIRVELQDETGKPVPGRSLAEGDEIVGDTIEQRVTWRGDGDISAWAGRPVRLRIAMREADLYSLSFVPPFFGPATPMMKSYFETLQIPAGGASCSDNDESCWFSADVIDELRPLIEQAREAARGNPSCERNLAPLFAGYTTASEARELLSVFPSLTPDELTRRLDRLGQSILRFDHSDVFGKGPAMYPPIAERWEAFRKQLTEQARVIAAAFADPRIAQNHDKRWHFQTDPQDTGLTAGWMKAEFDASAWPLIDADRWWQKEGYPDYHGVAWYRRSFDPPDTGPGKRMILYFGAVDGDATVFVNGRKVGEHLLLPDGTGWDQPFHLDVTDHLVKARPNLIAVRVRKDMYLSGIFRGVKLLEVGGIRNAAR
jgi:hypothetical protein